MKINNLKINGFGKLVDKKIELDDKINVIYGKNETGKSTLMNFIKSIFYGVDKSKSGKPISDFDKFEPWKTREYSGKISYELDNGESYDVFRDFKKKSPIIYNSSKQDISLSYPIDKSKGIDYIYEQIKVDEDTFKNTIIIEQNNIKVNKSVQNEMIQKISNIVSSGDENISYKRTLEKINKSQLEMVGTDRTKEKPINIINEKIERLKNSKTKIEGYKNFIEGNDEEVQDIQEKIANEEVKLSLYRIIKESNEKRKIKTSEIDVIKNIIDEYLMKIEELDNKIDKDTIINLKNKKQSWVLEFIFSFSFIIFSVVCFIADIKRIIPIISLVIAGSIIASGLIRRIFFNKNNKKKIDELEDLQEKINQEINILKNNIKSHQKEIENKQEDIKQAENELNRLVMNNFEDKLDSDLIEDAFDLEDDILDKKIADRNEKINSLKIEIGAKQNQKELMSDEIGDLLKINESLDELEEEKKELLSLNNSYNLARECLENAYENIRNSLSPEFINKLSEIVSEVSNGKYKEINFTDTDGLVVQIEDGRFLPVERLSQGTIDQMYLGLRLSTIDTISKEKMPIILDETFAFFDDDRLENVLKFINDKYEDRQIIIFTCSKREIEALNRLNMDYNYVDLEK